MTALTIPANDLQARDIIHTPHGNGYLTMRAPGHPLAGRNQRVFVHRKVLFDAIGPGSHPCHRCGIPVDWSEPFPTGLVVDHLDHDRANNVISNLAPSCHPCNVSDGAESAKTRCPQGHPYDEQNTRRAEGKRRCRACKSQYDRRRYATRKAVGRAVR